MPFYLSAQFRVKGVVTDNAGEGLPGATVIETGKQNGTATNMDGAFEMNVQSKDSKITIQYIGFKSRTMSVSANMKIVLRKR